MPASMRPAASRGLGAGRWGSSVYPRPSAETQSQTAHSLAHLPTIRLDRLLSLARSHPSTFPLLLTTCPASFLFPPLPVLLHILSPLPALLVPVPPHPATRCYPNCFSQARFGFSVSASVFVSVGGRDRISSGFSGPRTHTLSRHMYLYAVFSLYDTDDE